MILPERLFEHNRSKLNKALAKNSVAIIHSNDEMPRNGDQFFPFRQNSDLFYLTGIDQALTILILCPNHPMANRREILFIEKPNQLTETWYGKRLTKSEATEISGIKNILWIEDFDRMFDEMVYVSEDIYLNQYENPRFVTDVKSREARFTQKVQKNYPLHRLARLAPLMTSLRLAKEPEEIKIIYHACEITGKAFDRVLKTLKPGMHEFEVEAELSYEFRRHGATGHAFHPIVASGENACILHYVNNRNVCKDGDLLLLDFGAEFSNYASDCSRTIPVNGRFTKRQKQLYQSVLNVFNKTREMMIKGTSITIINKQVGKLWEEEHVNLGLYSMEDLHRQDPENPLYTQYFMHGISHFMGLDVHDVGNRLETFESGMVVTCEPGIYVREEGIGIRIENDILITEEAPIDLMKHIPMEIEEIEDLMNAGKK
ncbi:MAG: aminopeptidase P N-terminal domain-containing protein [Bacteroidota bacterium]|nr:aminopeptidase P N-terminal domain-containing protein [Bacteroidota bacterium]